MANMRPYDVAVSQAIEKGDARKLESLVNRARELHESYGNDLSKVIKKGESALKKLNKAKK